MRDTDKITLSLGQINNLITEARKNDDDDYFYSTLEMDHQILDSLLNWMSKNKPAYKDFYSSLDKNQKFYIDKMMKNLDMYSTKDSSKEEGFLWAIYKLYGNLLSGRRDSSDKHDLVYKTEEEAYEAGIKALSAPKYGRSDYTVIVYSTQDKYPSENYTMQADRFGDHITQYGNVMKYDNDKAYQKEMDAKRIKFNESNIIKESRDIHWEIFKAVKKEWGWDTDGRGEGIAYSDDSFDTVADARKDAIDWLQNEIKTPGFYIIMCEEDWDEINHIVVKLSRFGVKRYQ